MILNHDQVVRCPGCESDRATRVRKSADIVKCDGCGLVFLRTRPKVEDLEKFYQTYASNPGSHMRLPLTIEEAKQSGLRRQYFLNEIMEFTGPRRGRILDVGSGWGAFLHAAKDQGFEPTGVEICRQMADYASSTLGIKTYSQQLETCPFEPNQFRVVSMLHVFEHLPNQRNALNFIHRILEPEGFFCGIVPNFGSYASKAMGDEWPWLDSNWHYSHMDPETLPSFLHSGGFNVLRIYTKTGDFDRHLLMRQVEKRYRTSSTPIKEAEAMIESLEKKGEGEELRWVAQRI